MEKESSKDLQIISNNSKSISTFNFFDASQFDVMQRVSSMFASSELVPDMYQAKILPIPANATEEQRKEIQYKNMSARNRAIANCMIAIDAALRIGASPLMVMQNMVPIYGSPRWSSKFLIASINVCGRFDTLKYRIVEKGKLGMVDYIDYVWGGNGKKVPTKKQFDGRDIMNLECIAYTTEKGKTDVLESAPVSLELAVKEGWYTKNGSKWPTMPRQMLMYRAASWWASAYAPELSMGMQTIEEARDFAEFEELPKETIAAANKISIGFGCEPQTVKAEMIEDESAEQQPEPEQQPQPEQKPEAKPEPQPEPQPRPDFNQKPSF